MEEWGGDDAEGGFELSGSLSDFENWAVLEYLRREKTMRPRRIWVRTIDGRKLISLSIHEDSVHDFRARREECALVASSAGLEHQYDVDEIDQANRLRRTICQSFENEE